MICPECNGDTNVINTRSKGSTIPQAYGGVLTYRRRACQDCQHRFSTYEGTKPILFQWLDVSAKVSKTLSQKIADNILGIVTNE